MMRFCALSSHGTSAPKAHKFPDATTFGRIFRLFSPGRCVELAEVENEARRKVWPKKWFGKITLDMDSTVHGVYGSQEASEQGYNPNPPDCCRQGGQEKKGKKVTILSCALLPKTENVSTIGFAQAVPTRLTAAWNSCLTAQGRQV